MLIQDMEAQLKLPLPRPKPAATWGGRRRNAGRKPKGQKAGHPHERRDELSPRDGAHVTLRLVAGLPSLRSATWLPAVEAAFAAERDRKGFRLCHYAVLDNHFHLVCEADDRVALWRGVQRLCVRLARAINRRLGRKGRVFSDRYHRRTLTNPTQARNTLAYVLLNGQRHGGGAWLDTWEEDPYTSCRSFDGWRRRPPPSDAGSGPAPVTAPRSWLLREGWKLAKRGRIDPTEVPGPA
jgi:hypothetical protein